MNCQSTAKRQRIDIWGKPFNRQERIDNDPKFVNFFEDEPNTVSIIPKSTGLDGSRYPFLTGDRKNPNFHIKAKVYGRDRAVPNLSKEQISDTYSAGFSRLEPNNYQIETRLEIIDRERDDDPRFVVNMDHRRRARLSRILTHQASPSPA